MKTKHLTKLLLAGIVCAGTMACNGNSTKGGTDADSTATDSSAIVEQDLKADEAINRAARFYAGISSDGIQMSEADAKSWQKYSETMKQMIDKTKNNRSMVDSLARTDFADFRDKVDYVFYPFSGADFMYPITIFPDADTYFLCGLENPGSPIGDKVQTKYEMYEAYRIALATYFRTSYFITKEMNNDLKNKEIDGTYPVITMLMAVAGYDIISIKYKNINEAGDFVDASLDDAKAVEYKFFKNGSKHLQTLYYVSGNVINSAFDANLKAYLSKTLPQHKVGSYLKAASYLMHYGSFSDMRDYVVNYSMAVIEDDSGIPYHFFTDDYDVTLYGKYVRPLKDFSNACFQKDLDEIYKRDAAKIHPLKFRIGYNTPSNWLCARRKAGK